MIDRGDDPYVKDDDQQYEESRCGTTVLWMDLEKETDHVEGAEEQADDGHQELHSLLHKKL